MAKILLKRGTRAQVEAGRVAGTLAAGEPYLVTDDKTAALGTGPGEYVDLAVVTGAKRIAVVSALPGSPDADTIYLVTS